MVQSLSKLELTEGRTQNELQNVKGFCEDTKTIIFAKTQPNKKQ